MEVYLHKIKFPALNRKVIIMIIFIVSQQHILLFSIIS